jgi:hypothetical protein
MEITHNRVPEGSDRFDHVEHLLSRYPAITAGEVEDLKRWFNKEASAFDVASLASIESIHASYAAFRAEHIDGFKARDYFVVVAALLLAGAAILYLAT